MKTFKFPLVLRTRENTDVFISLDDNNYGIHSKRINILYVLVDHILSGTICPFCFCVLFANMYPKIKFTTKNLSYAISVEKFLFILFLFHIFFFFFFFFFLIFCQRIIFFLLCFAEFEIFMSHNHIMNRFRKTELVDLVGNLPPSYLPYRFLRNLHYFFNMAKRETI